MSCRRYDVKTIQKKKGLTFGDFVAGVYEVVGKRKAQEVVRLAVNTRHVGFLGPLRYVVT